MSRDVFGKVYADQYDILYGSKDYEAECDLIEEVFRRYGDGGVRRILDLGCGTGNHAIPLAQRGYQVHGVDISEDMLVHAREKADSRLLDGSVKLVFTQGDIRSIDLGQRFDAALMMFAVLGYQLTNDDVLAALQSVRRHLRPGGLFICDVWYGPAVLAIRPSDRVKVIKVADGQLIRVATGELDVFHHWATISYHLWRIRGTEVVSETEEFHQMRYFFPQELAFFFSQAGLALIDMCEFDDLTHTPDEMTWNTFVIGKRV